MVSKDGKVEFSTKFFYGIGSVAYGVKNNGFDYFLFFFYAQVVGLPVQYVSVGILIVFICDAISDPLVGHISDNWHSRLGRRHPFMYAAAVPVAFSYFLLWNPPQGLGHGTLLAYFIVLAVCVRTFITFYEIPSSSLVSELTDDYDQRTSILSFRYFFGWTGGLAIAVLAYTVFFVPTDEYPIGQFNLDGYYVYGIVAAIIMFVTIMTSAIGTHRHIPNLRKPPPKRPFNFKQTAGEVVETLSNRNIRILFLSAVVMYIGAGVTTNLNLYFNTFFWGFTALQIGIITIGNFASAGLALGLAPYLTRRRDKRSVAIGTWIFAIIFLPVPILLRLVGFFPENGSPFLLPIMMIHSIIDVGVIIMASILVASMVADVVEESERATGRRSEGLFFAVRSFAYKVVHGLGAVGAAMIIGIIGLETGATPEEVSPETVRNLGIVFVPVWLGFYLTAIYILSYYSITRKSHGENVNELSSRPQPTLNKD